MKSEYITLPDMDEVDAHIYLLSKQIQACDPDDVREHSPFSFVEHVGHSSIVMRKYPNGRITGELVITFDVSREEPDNAD